jgi:hypothetical protein
MPTPHADIETPIPSNDVAYDAADPAVPDQRDFFSERDTPGTIPAEVWLLWSDNPDMPGHGHWLVTFDDAPGGPTFLASFSEAEARRAAEHQFETYGIWGRPVRVK